MRTRWLILGIGLVTLLVAIGMGYVIARHRQQVRADAHLELGRLSLEQGNHELALTEINESLRLVPHHAAAFRTRARLFTQQYRWDEAIADLDEAIRLSPRAADLYLLRAEVYLNRSADQDRAEDLDHVVQDADQALSLDPTLAHAFCFRALARSNKQENDLALADIEEAIARDRNDPLINWGRGCVRAARGESTGAIADFTEACKQEPVQVRAYVGRALCQLDRHETADTLADAEQAIHSDRSNAWGYLVRAMAYLEEGRRELALTDLNRALELNSKNVVAHSLRASCYLELHQPARALADANAGLAIHPNSGTALAVRALAHLQSGKKMRAQADLRRAAQLAPRNLKILHARVVLLQELGKHAEVVEETNGLAKEVRKEAVAILSLRAMSNLCLGEPGRAIVDCTRAIEQDGSRANPYAIRSVAMARIDSPEAARDDFRRAIEIDQRMAYHVRGPLHLLLKENERALADLGRAIQLNPREPTAYLTRANLLMTEPMPKVEEGLNDCDRAIGLSPRDPLAYRLRALGHVLKKDYEAALADCNRALELDPEDVQAYTLRAEAHLARKDMKQVIVDATAALHLEGTEAKASALRALAYSSEGQHEKAQADIERASQLDSQYAKWRDQLKTAPNQGARVESPQATLPEPPADSPREPFPWTRAGILAALVGLMLIGLFGGWMILKSRRPTEQPEAVSPSPPILQAKYSPPPEPDPILTSAQVAAKAEQTNRLIEFLAHRDPAFAPLALREGMTGMFQLVHQCWQERDCGAIQDLVMPVLLRRYEEFLKSLRQKGEINRLEDLALERLELVHVYCPHSRDEQQVTALVTFQADSYFVSERSLEYLHGSRSPQHFQEFWVFQRQGNLWRLLTIERSHQSDRLQVPNQVEDLTEEQIAHIQNSIVL